MLSLNGNVTTIGFGTAALGSSCFNAVTWALESGFRRFDTAEERDYWYDQECVGRALQSYFQQQQQRQNNQLSLTCQGQDPTQAVGDPVTCSNTIEWPPTIFEIDTKIPPYVFMLFIIEYSRIRIVILQLYVYIYCKKGGNLHP
jgi:hypothetical protein